IEGDIRDQHTVERAMDDVDVVFHEAAKVSVEDSIQRPLDSHAVNATGTLRFLEAARNVDARVVAASSAAIYGHPTETPIPESEPKTPTSPYGIQKLALDHYLQQYTELYGLPTVALRYFNVFGPRQQGGDYSGVISIFKKQVKNGDPITVDGDGGQTRDFIHVSDVVRANLRTATADVAGEAFNIGTGTSISIRELAETVNQLTDGNSEIQHRDPRSGDIRHSEAEISKARSELGFRPRVSVKEGLRDMME
ncbi:MAG: NAD-dependent epimerase/dehydratase family protein, partial [Halobacteriaceae archaeon]